MNEHLITAWLARPATTLIEQTIKLSNCQDFKEIILPSITNVPPPILPDLNAKYIPNNITIENILNLSLNNILNIYCLLPDTIRLQLQHLFTSPPCKNILPNNNNTEYNSDSVSQPMIQTLDANKINNVVSATHSSGLFKTIFAGQDRISVIGPDGIFYSIRKCKTYKLKQHSLSTTSILFELRFDFKNMIAWIHPPIDKPSAPAEFIETLEIAFNQFYRNVTNSDDVVPVNTIISNAIPAKSTLTTNGPVVALGMKRARRPPKSLTKKTCKKTNTTSGPIVSLPCGSFGGITEPIYFPIEYDNWIVLTNDDIIQLCKLDKTTNITSSNYINGTLLLPYLSNVLAPTAFLEYFGKTNNSTHVAYAVDVDIFRKFYENNHDNYITALKMFCTKRRSTTFSQLLKQEEHQ